MRKSKRVPATSILSSHQMIGVRRRLKKFLRYPKIEMLEDRIVFDQGSDPMNIVQVNSNLAYFHAFAQQPGPFDPKFGRELIKTNGTRAGTKVVKDINPGSTSALSDPWSDLTKVGSTLFFVAQKTGKGLELWKSNGTKAGTKIVKDIYPSSGSNVGNSEPRELTNMGGTLFFTAFNPNKGRELWKSDGTKAGTKIVKDIFPGSTNSIDFEGHLTVFKNKLYFAARNANKGVELWKSDGTSAGTKLVKDINPGSNSSNPEKLTVVGNKLFFTAHTSKGRELWVTNGTGAGTKLVKNITPGSNGSYPKNLTKVGTTLFFSANNGNKGYELWKSNGTATGTKLVKDIMQGAGSSNPGMLTAFNGSLLFSADNGTKGVELWKSDGTGPGTKILKDIRPGSQSSINVFGFASEFLKINNTVYFMANNGVKGHELWKTNGTKSGTKMVKDITTGGSSYPREFAKFNNKLLFSADNGPFNHGREIWISNGTAAGTKLLKNINGGFIGFIVAEQGGASAVSSASAADELAVPTVNESEFESLVDAAIQHWQTAGALSESEIDLLRNASTDFDDLPGDQLAAFSKNEIVVDLDAAGHGWFVDASPEDNHEFPIRASETVRQASLNSAAHGKMDLLSAVMLGQRKFLELHLDDLDQRGGIETAAENESLSVSTRKAIVSWDVPPITPQFDVNNDGSLTPLDVLLVVNRINADTGINASSEVIDFDVNQDGAVSPLDVLFIVNELNGLAAEGESSSADSLAIDYPDLDEERLANSLLD